MSAATADHALALARAGLHVFPLAHRSKAPLTANGHRDATTDPAIVAAWFAKWPKANLSIALEPSGLLVVGPDSPEWAATFAERGLPDTAAAQTGGGEGHLHFYFRMPDGCPVHRICKSGQYDLISNGYTVAPPSIHPKTGHPYAWLASPDGFLDADGALRLPDAPDWAVAELAKAAGPKATPGERRERAEPPPVDDDEPPVRLDAEALGWWRGERTATKPDGSIDASRTLYRIGVALAKAGLTRKALADAIRDRDEALGYAKFYNRADPDREYEREAQRAWEAAERERGDRPNGDANGRIHNSRELLSRRFGPTRYAVDGLLPVGSAVVAGKPKVGKSWLALDLALAVATGGAVLGYPAQKSGRVLYLALEDSPRRLHNRLRKLLYGGEDFDTPEANPFASAAEYVFDYDPASAEAKGPTDGVDFATGWPRSDQGGLEKIAAWRAKHADARLVIIDTLQRFRPPSNAKAGMYEDDYAALGAIHRFCADIGLSVVCVHHTRKLGSNDPLDLVSGSNGLTGAVDSLLVLQRSRGTADAELFVTGRDLPDELNLALTFERSHARWNVLGTAEEVRRSKEQTEILAALREHGQPMTPTQLAAALGVTRHTVSMRLRTMGGHDLVKNVGSGKWWVV